MAAEYVAEFCRRCPPTDEELADDTTRWEETSPEECCGPEMSDIRPVGSELKAFGGTQEGDTT